MKELSIVIIVLGVACVVAGAIMCMNSSKEDQVKQPQQIESMVATTPATAAPASPKEKGNEFENVVANIFKDRDVFSVLEWNQGVTSSEGVYAEADKNPDFKIKQSFEGKDLTYWVECKYRSSASGSVLIKNYQLERYRKIQSESHLKVFVAIGAAGTPSSPQDFFLVPLDSIHSERVEIADLRPFSINQNGPAVAKYIHNYFVYKVFQKKGHRNKH